MKLTDYLNKQKLTQAYFADSVGVTVSMVNQWLSEHRPVSPIQCVAIEKVTNGEVGRKDLRPDDWDQIWPELKDVA